MRLRQFTPRLPNPYVQITPREWNPDPEFIIKHNDLYSRAWVSEYEKPKIDSDYNNAETRKSSVVTVRSEIVADKSSIIPGTIRGNSLEIFPQADRLCDGMDTDNYKEPYADTSILTLRLSTPAARFIIHVTMQNRIAMTITDIVGTVRYCKPDFNTTPYFILTWSTEYFRKQFGKCPIFEVRIQNGYPRTFSSILRILSVQLHALHSFSLCTKDDYCKWILNTTDYKCENSILIINLCVPCIPWNTGELRRSRPLLLVSQCSNFFSSAVMNEKRLADGLATENCFFGKLGLTRIHFFIHFPGLSADRLQQGKSSSWFSSIYWTNPTSTTSKIRTVVGAQPHQPLMMQQCPYQTNASVYLWLSFSSAKL